MTVHCGNAQWLTSLLGLSVMECYRMCPVFFSPPCRTVAGARAWRRCLSLCWWL